MRTRRSAAEWRRLDEQYQQSGLTIDAFCQQQGLAKSSFALWRRKLTAAQLMSSVQAGEFIEVNLGPRVTNHRPTAAETIQGIGELVVELPFGVRLRFRGLQP